MARIIGGNPNGEFRGKLGGLVYSRNKAGQYARSYAKPVDPRTEAQIAARASFAQAISGFHTLSSQAKGDWNSFASQYFTSRRRGNVPGVHSGVNAFVSLRNCLINSDRLRGNLPAPVVIVNHVPATAIVEKTIVLPVFAPIQPLQGVLDYGNYIISPQSFSTYFVNANEITVDLTLIPAGTQTPSGPSPSEISILQSGDGKKVGFNVYVSNMVPQAGVHISNPQLNLLGSSGLIDSYTTPEVVSNNIAIKFASAYNPESTKNPITLNGFYQLSTFMFDESGQQILISSSIQEITAE